MNRLIDADKLKKGIFDVYEQEFPTATGVFDRFVTAIIPSIINMQPIVDAAPVVHGHWIDCDGNYVQIGNDGSPNAKGGVWCSVCGEWLTASDEYSAQGHYCPNCGAKMDEEVR